MGAQPQHRVEFLGRGDLVDGAIQILSIRVRVRAHADALRVHHHRSFAGARVFVGFSHRAHGVEDVGAVAVNHTQILDAAVVVGDVGRRRLLLDGHRDAVAVVLQHKNDGQHLTARSRIGFKAIAL